jgi:hypothetical protein
MTWVRLIELSVALILAPAALSKAVDGRGFATAVRRFDVVPSGLATIVALGTVGVEIALSLLLAAGLAEAPALAVAALLFAAFSGVAWLEVSRQEADEPIPECGCLGGVLRLRMGRGSALLNLLVAAVCAGAAIAAVAGNVDDGALSLNAVELVLLAVPLAAVYWLAHYALSVIATMGMRMRETGEVP